MTLHASRKSVAGQIGGRPLNMVRSIADTPMVQVAKQLLTYIDTLPSSSKAIRPEVDALRFYVLEHAAGMLRAKHQPHDELPDGDFKVLDTYNKLSLQMAVRAYYYLLLICWREARHCGSKYTTYAASGTAVGVDPQTMESFLRLASDTSDYKSIATNWEKAGAITLGQLTRALIYTYRKGKWGSAYGGPKWAVVTECLDSFVHGKTSAAMMLDTVWTLAHNTAPIFNKGMLYSGQNAHQLLEILDVQRAGMIPQYILTAAERGYSASEHVAPALRQAVKGMAPALGGVFTDGSDVDWPLVMALGAKGSYSQYAAKLGQKASDATAAQATAAKTAYKSTPAAKTSPGVAANTTNAAVASVKKLVPGVTVKLGRQEAA